MADALKILSNPALSNMAIMLLVTQYSKRLPWDDPNTVFYARCCYVASVVLVMGIYLYTRMLITKKKDLTTLKYVQPANVASGQEEQLITTTVMQYDLEQISAAIKGVFTGLAMMGFMHLYMKYTNPLIIQSILPLKGALEHNEVKLHVFGKAASGDLKRPFKAASLFSGLGGAEPLTDKKAISEAETKGTGGVKSD
ncbi:hypothetical protein CANCADRAFT_30999 [Tortispora caseinolytica NRRL Y-17796]|uniref:Inorganic phosphate transport PHO88 n=1 Tax=Tortispora caseinolytica NRRL Y-17796 TaxID=767744 RepID=A0A1E4TDQ8_9ASCO|nr:hypothetical protein CANCADRAFT_30999 [Tortispora caseinolytica NRRL Y-17796]